MATRSASDQGKRRLWRISTTVPLEWKDKLRKRVAMGGYVSIMDYLRDLVREDLKRVGLLQD